METMNDNKKSRLNESAFEQNVLKQEYAYLINRERKIAREKKELLNKLHKLQKILEKSS